MEMRFVAFMVRIQEQSVVQSLQMLRVEAEHEWTIPTTMYFAKKTCRVLRATTETNFSKSRFSSRATFRNRLEL